MHVYLALLAAVAVFLTHPSNVTAIPLADFYPFGDGTGDTALPQTDDGSSPEIDLSTSFPFFNKSHSTLFVSGVAYISGSKCIISSSVETLAGLVHAWLKHLFKHDDVVVVWTVSVFCVCLFQCEKWHCQLSRC